MGPLLPRAQYLLDDLTTVDDQMLRARPLTPVVQVAFACLRQAPGDDDVTVWLGRWREEIAGLSRPAATVVVAYLLEVGNTSTEHLQQFAATIGPEIEEIAVTTAQQLRAEGRIQGRAEGQAHLLLSQLTTRYGALDPEIRRRVETSTSEQIELWSTRFAEGADTLDDVFI